MQIGDIVALYGVDGGVYYAQIRGFLTDQYCEKSATISWLLPTGSSPPPEEGFDPSTYILGKFMFNFKTKEKSNNSTNYFHDFYI